MEKKMIIMRGLPGSGKSFLARRLTTNTSSIFSTDDYFYDADGKYEFNVMEIESAHSWNIKRAIRACLGNISPIVIDNTNTRIWEMKPYFTMAKSHGYLVSVVVPETPWAFDPIECARRTAHGVPYEHICKMLQRWEQWP